MNLYIDDKPARHWTFNNDPEPPLSPPEPKGWVCDWCGVETSGDLEIREYVLCQDCYNRVHNFDNAIEYLNELLNEGLIGSVKTFFETANVNSEKEFAESVLEHFGDEYLDYVKF